MLDFTPNAVHSGLYAARREGWFDDAGLDLEIRPPGRFDRRPEAAGRRPHRLRRHGHQRPGRGRRARLRARADRRPRASAARVGDRRRRVPSVRATWRAPRSASPACRPTTRCSTPWSLRTAGDPATIERTVIGFDSVAALSAGRVDAATAFWNAEGVALKELGVPTQEFRVGDFAAEPFPELVVVTTGELARGRAGARRGDAGGLGARVRACGRGAGRRRSTDLLGAIEEIEADTQEAQMEALVEADAFSAGVEPGRLTPARYENWKRFAKPSTESRCRERSVMHAEYDNSPIRWPSGSRRP